jgi:hypothetical protein
LKRVKEPDILEIIHDGVDVILTMLVAYLQNAPNHSEVLYVSSHEFDLHVGTLL